MYACLYWYDHNGLSHTMRADAIELMEDAECLDELGYAWKLETFDYTAKDDDA